MNMPRANARHLFRAGVVVLATGVFGGTALAGTLVKSYAVPIGTEYSVKPLLSVGDKVKHLGEAPGSNYQMIGIPDGLGAYPNVRSGNTTVLMNHELGNTVLSEPEVGKPLNRGAFVSKFVMNGNGDVLSGERAYDNIFIESATTSVPAPTTANATPGFGRLCSSSLS